MTTLVSAQSPAMPLNETGKAGALDTPLGPESARENKRDTVSNEHLSWEKECQKVLASYFSGPLND